MHSQCTIYTDHVNLLIHTNDLKYVNTSSQDLDCRKFFLVSSNKTTRGHLNKLFVRHSHVDVLKYFFGNCIVKIWNSLPATAADFFYNL